jgi:integrase
MLMVLAGLRLGEALRLKWSSVDLQTRRIYVSRVVFPWLSAAPDAKEQQKAEKRVRRAMERTLVAVGLHAHFTPHRLRHAPCKSFPLTGTCRGAPLSRPSPGCLDQGADNTEPSAQPREKSGFEEET